MPDTIVRPGAVYTIMRRVLDAIRTELECRGAPACRYDMITSQSATQRGADLRGPGGSQGRVWVRLVQETAPNLGAACPTWMWADLEVGVLRCHTTVAADERSLPDSGVYEDETLRSEQDARSVTAALARVRPRVVVTGRRPYGPQGGAVGVLVQARARRRA